MIMMIVIMMWLEKVNKILCPCMLCCLLPAPCIIFIHSANSFVSFLLRFLFQMDAWSEK